MTDPAVRPGAAPRATGLLIGVVFGLVFVEANSLELHGRWQGLVRAAGAIVAAALFIGIGRARRAAEARGATSGRAHFGRGYWLIVAVEAVALVAGLVVINKVFSDHELTVAWIAVVVGVHFFGLAVIWTARIFLALGTAVALLGVAGFALHAGGASNAAVALVSGICSGVAMYLAVISALVSSAAPVRASR